MYFFSGALGSDNYLFLCFLCKKFAGEGLDNPNKFSELLETSEPERSFKKKVARQKLYTLTINIKGGGHDGETEGNG